MKSKDKHDAEAAPASEPNPAKSLTHGRRVAFVCSGTFIVGLFVLSAFWFQSHQKISSLSGEIDIERAKVAALQSKFDDLGTAYARLVAEKRCEVIDGLDDCLAAGLARPERFAESDKAVLIERAVTTPRHAQLIAVPTITNGAGTSVAENDEHAVATPLRAIRPASGRIKEDLMREELSKIPGIAMEKTGPRKPPSTESR
jgi:hypothetical protein